MGGKVRIQSRNIENETEDGRDMLPQVEIIDDSPQRSKARESKDYKIKSAHFKPLSSNTNLIKNLNIKKTQSILKQSIVIVPSHDTCSTVATSDQRDSPFRDKRKKSLS